MGLDQWLEKSVFVGNNEVRLSIQTKDADVPVNPGKIKYIREGLITWRKANAIHQWFAHELSDGVLDNCAEYSVSRDQLERLLADVESVLANPALAEERLPAQDGFFFGSTNYDDWYFEDLEHTRKKLKEILSEKAHPSVSYIYCAWW